jgi:hypothetical protein
MCFWAHENLQKGNKNRFSCSKAHFGQTKLSHDGDFFVLLIKTVILCSDTQSIVLTELLLLLELLL